MLPRLREGSMVVLLLLMASTATAADGVFEVNQSCALVGCFPGDNPGFPVDIASPGSYRLSSNLDLRSINASAIRVTASFPGAEIDLNGFALLGPGSCGVGGSGVSCVGLVPGQAGVSIQGNAYVHGGKISGFTNGIFNFNSAESRLADLEIYDSETHVVVASAATMERIKLSRASASCLELYGPAEIRNAHVADCGNHGISNLGTKTLRLSDSLIERFVASGVRAGDGSTILRTTVQAGGANGSAVDAAIGCGRGCLVQNCVVTANGGNGIRVGVLAHVIENQLDQNGSTAVGALDGSTVSRNTIGAATFSGGLFTAISCTLGCGVFDNVIRNAGPGVSLSGPSSVYGRNVISFHGGAVSGTGTSAGDNFCDGAQC